MYSVNDLSLLRTLDLPPGSGRTATALSPCEQPNLLALPAAAGAGTLRVYDLMVSAWEPRPRGVRSGVMLIAVT